MYYGIGRLQWTILDYEGFVKSIGKVKYVDSDSPFNVTRYFVGVSYNSAVKILSLALKSGGHISCQLNLMAALLEDINKQNKT